MIKKHRYCAITPKINPPKKVSAGCIFNRDRVLWLKLMSGNYQKNIISR